MKRILVDARTPVNYAMFAPVHAAMRDDARVRFYFTASEDPSRARAIFREAGPDARIVSPALAAVMPFDAYITSDFTWLPLLFRTCRIQMFHGVGGKYGFDAPTESLRAWHRLFFVNRRRLTNCIAAGAIDADSRAIRLIGMPKVDCLVDGSLDPREVLQSLGLDPQRPTVLYAPTWSPASSLNRLGIELVKRLRALPINLVVKLHDRSCDPRPQYSGAVDWRAALAPHLQRGSAILVTSADICPYLAAADVMVTDHSSAGFEYLLRDRPLVRIHMPELIALANVHHDYVRLLAEVSESATDVADTVAAVERALADPGQRSAARRAVAADLFHEPGTATARCAAALYEAINLEPARVTLARQEGRTAGRQPVVSPCARRAAVTPTVSVIMPAYNAERYLETAVESVLRQTFTDFELLIVDDGSADGTVAVARRYADRDPRVRVLQQRNAGPGPARNTAFRAAAGRFFAFLDSDDEWDDTFLAEQLAVLAMRPDVDVVVGNARNRGGPRDGQPSRPLRRDGVPITLAEILADETSLFIMAVFRREVIEAVGGFDTELLTNEEYEMWIRAALAGFSFTRHTKPLGWYACRPGSLSSSDTRMLSGILRVFAKTRAALPPRSPERAILEEQIARFEAELAAAERRARVERHAVGRALLQLRRALRGAHAPGNGGGNRSMPRVEHVA